MHEPEIRRQLVELSRVFSLRSWSLATSGNYSARLDDSKFVITTTGKDKSDLTESDFVVVPVQGAIPENASAETMLHRDLYRSASVGAILHTHSVFSTVLSLEAGNRITFRGYEMQKAIRGTSDPENEVVVPVFPNHQDMSETASEVTRFYQHHELRAGFILAGHGLYSIGSDIAEAKRHAEALEFLLECAYRRRIIKLR